MNRSDDEYWATERASYDDELDAWRERTTTPAGIASPVAPWEPGPWQAPRHSWSVSPRREEASASAA